MGVSISDAVLLMLNSYQAVLSEALGLDAPEGSPKPCNTLYRPSLFCPGTSVMDLVPKLQALSLSHFHPGISIFSLFLKLQASYPPQAATF